MRYTAGTLQWEGDAAQPRPKNFFDILVQVGNFVGLVLACPGACVPATPDALCSLSWVVHKAR